MSKTIEVSWRSVVGYEGLYSVSSEGQVRAEEKTVKGNQHQSGRRLKPKAMSLWTHDCGYMMVTLKDQQAKKRHWRVHQLVAIAFLGEPPTAKHEPNHKNRNRADNSVGNLEWVTRSENLAHSWANPMRDRTGNVGPKNGSAKLTEAEAISIRRRFAGGERPAAIARDFPHIDYTNVWMVATGKTWKHLGACV